jgi:putative transcriptional regulator
MTDAKPRFRSRVAAEVHEGVARLHGAGVVGKQTMREFDAMCLTPVPTLSASAIRKLRARECVSQNVFAHYLNVTPILVSKWERGEKKPSGPSLKLLALVKNRGLQAIT